jgi:quercetin dioxygenase-like cupin family protein
MGLPAAATFSTGAGELYRLAARPRRLVRQSHVRYLHPLMPKTTRTYWNPLASEHKGDWQPIEGLEGVAEELTLAIDNETGDYTRLTRFAPGADTTPFGPKTHDDPEEIFIIEGRLHDDAFDRWLTKGDYASRPPGEPHGTFRTEEGCLVLEISYPSQSIGPNDP